MEHIRPLVVKFIYIAAITIVFLSYLLIPAVTLGSSLIISLVVTLVLYFAGDRFLLQRFGALPTAIANFVIAAVILALAGPFVRQTIGTGAILATSAVIGVAEWLFYRYIRSSIGAASGGAEMAPVPDFFGSDEKLQQNSEEEGEQQE